MMPGPRIGFGRLHLEFRHLGQGLELRRLSFQLIIKLIVRGPQKYYGLLGRGQALLLPGLFQPPVDFTPHFEQEVVLGQQGLVGKPRGRLGKARQVDALGAARAGNMLPDFIGGKRQDGGHGQGEALEQVI